MHEMTVTRSLLEIVNDKVSEINAGKVNRINILVGELSGVEKDSVSFYFDIMKKDYNVADAEIAFVDMPAVMTCRDCGKEFDYDPVSWLCPGCSSASLQVLKGSECYVESIEVDE